MHSAFGEVVACECPYSMRESGGVEELLFFEQTPSVVLI